MPLLEMIGKLTLAVLAGGLVGLERERQDRQAGLRTHILVCVGSALFTLVSVGMAGGNDDRTRIAAQIVSGIGFLGAGTIFRYGSSVRGLTTAAGLWTVAAMGMAIAAGGVLLQLALFTSVLVFMVNKWLRILENRWLRVNQLITLALAHGHDSLVPVFAELSRRRIEVHRVLWLTEEENGDHLMVQLRLRMSSPAQLEGLPEVLGCLPGIQRVDVE